MLSCWVSFSCLCISSFQSLCKTLRNLPSNTALFSQGSVGPTLCLLLPSGSPLMLAGVLELFFNFSLALLLQLLTLQFGGNVSIRSHRLKKYWARNITAYYRAWYVGTWNVHLFGIIVHLSSKSRALICCYKTLQSSGEDFHRIVETVLQWFALIVFTCK